MSYSLAPSGGYVGDYIFIYMCMVLWGDQRGNFEFRPQTLNPKPYNGGLFRSLDYLEGQGDLVSRLITPITHIVTLFIPIINLLTKSP